MGFRNIDTEFIVDDQGGANSTLDLTADYVCNLNDSQIVIHADCVDSKNN